MQETPLQTQFDCSSHRFTTCVTDTTHRIHVWMWTRFAELNKFSTQVLAKPEMCVFALKSTQFQDLQLKLSVAPFTSERIAKCVQRESQSQRTGETIFVLLSHFHWCEQSNVHTQSSAEIRVREKHASSGYNTVWWRTTLQRQRRWKVRSVARLSLWRWQHRRGWFYPPLVLLFTSGEGQKEKKPLAVLKILHKIHNFGFSVLEKREAENMNEQKAHEQENSHGESPHNMQTNCT